jgi:hypothetical protein
LGGPSDDAATPADPLEVPEPSLTLDPGSDLSVDPLTPSQNTPAEPAANAPDVDTAVDSAATPRTPESNPPTAPGTPPEPATAETPSPAPEKPATEPDPDAYVGVHDAPMYVKNEVDAALAEAQAAEVAIQSAEAAAAPEAEQQFYTALTGLAERLTYSDVNDPKIAEVAQQAKDLLVQGNVRERAQLLMAHGPARLTAKKEDRPDNGVVLFGRVQAVEKKNALYETRLEMPSAGGPAVVPVFSKTDPQLESGAPIIVLGTIVDQPAKRLSGYDGGLPSVVWMSHAAPLK